MASEGAWERVGSATGIDGRKAWVWRRPDGSAAILDGTDGMRFGPQGAAELRELLDRAAMPGQPGAAGEAAQHG
jgi:hypothetical protein